MAPYFLVLLILHGSEGAAINSVPMPDEVSCQSAARSFEAGEGMFGESRKAQCLATGLSSDNQPRHTGAVTLMPRIPGQGLPQAPEPERAFIP